MKPYCIVLRLPRSMQAKVKAAAKAEGVSVNQFLTMAVISETTRWEASKPTDTGEK